MSSFEDVKDSLLSYYAGCQSSCGTRLLGFIAALFTLVEAARIGQLSSIELPYWTWIKLPILFTGVFLLMAYAVRTTFRYAAFSGLCSFLIDIQQPENFGKKSEDKDAKEASKHKQVNEELFEVMIKEKIKVFWLFNFRLFVTCSTAEERKIRREKKQEKIGKWKKVKLWLSSSEGKGWILSLGLGLWITCLLLLLLLN